MINQLPKLMKILHTLLFKNHNLTETSGFHCVFKQVVSSTYLVQLYCRYFKMGKLVAALKPK